MAVKGQGTVNVTITFQSRTDYSLSSFKPASSDTSQFQAKEMGHRIQQLGSVLQSSVSDEPHPLLHDDLLSINQFSKKPRKSAKEDFRDITAETIDICIDNR
jgi:hypothetical protein